LAGLIICLLPWLGLFAPLGSVLRSIAQMPWPIDIILWLAVLFPLAVIGPSLLWLFCYRLLSRITIRGK
jgi:hypothetical protein